MNRAVIAMVVLATATVSTSAFEVDGYTSGRTIEETTSAVRLMGYELRRTQVSTTSSWAEYRAVKPDETGQVQADGLGPAFYFCRGRLAAYMRTIDFDLDFVPQLEVMKAKLGDPKSTKIDRQPWSGPGGGFVLTVRMIWNPGKEEASISFGPEGRTNDGKLRHYRAASYAYYSYPVGTPQCP